VSDREALLADHEAGMRGCGDGGMWNGPVIPSERSEPIVIPSERSESRDLHFGTP